MVGCHSHSGSSRCKTGVTSLRPAHTGGGSGDEDTGPSSYRRSYSVNLDVDVYDGASPLTQLAERQFALVRDLTGYSVYAPGQEPINSVLYRNIGDEVSIYIYIDRYR